MNGVINIKSDYNQGLISVKRFLSSNIAFQLVIMTP